MNDKISTYLNSSQLPLVNVTQATEDSFTEIRIFESLYFLKDDIVFSLKNGRIMKNGGAIYDLIRKKMWLKENRKPIFGASSRQINLNPNSLSVVIDSEKVAGLIADDRCNIRNLLVNGDYEISSLRLKGIQKNLWELENISLEKVALFDLEVSFDIVDTMSQGDFLEVYYFGERIED